MVDRHIHGMKDPGLTADVARFRVQVALQEELTATVKALKEHLHNNHDDLLDTTHRLIYARVPTCMFWRIFADETPFESNHGSHPYSHPCLTHSPKSNSSKHEHALQHSYFCHDNYCKYHTDP